MARSERAWRDEVREAPEPHQDTPRWRVLRHIVFRSTGFPFELIETLRCDEAVKRMRQLTSAEAAVREVRSRIASDAIARAVAEEARSQGRKEVLKALSTTRRRLTHATPLTSGEVEVLKRAGVDLACDLAALLSAHEDREEQLRVCREAFAREFEAKRAVLAVIAQDARFQEALFISNPNMFRTALPAYEAERAGGRDGGKLRKLEKKLIAYVQRFCAKNDTAAFFGPMNHGHVDRELGQVIDVGIPARRTDAQRMVFFAFWSVEALADRIGADQEVRPFLKPRVNPVGSVTVDGRAYFHFIDKSLALGEMHARIVRAANGKRTVPEMAEYLHIAPEALVRGLEQMVRAQVLIWRLSIPSTIFHPFDYLVRTVRDLPPACASREKWLAVLAELDLLREQYRTAPLSVRDRLLSCMEAMFQEVAGTRPERGAGQTYADRSIIYEECGGDVERFVLGRPFVDDLEKRMGPVLRLCQSYGERQWAHYQEVGRAVFAASGAPGEMPYSRFVNVLKRLQEQGAVSVQGERAAALKQKLCERVRERSDGHVARLSARDIDEITAGYDRSRVNYHVSPDVLIRASSLRELQEGRFQLVLGEFHAFMLPWGSQLYFYPDRKDAERELAEAVAQMPEYEQLAIILNVRRHKGLILESFPGTFIEMFAKSSKEEGRGALPISRILAVLEGGELKLREADGEQRFKIYTGGDEKLNLWLFAPPPVLQVPISLGRHTPRVEIEGVVYQRERWELSRTEVLPPPGAKVFDRFLDLWRRKTELALPDRVFVKASAEKKPIYIDFAIPFLTELLYDLPRGDGKLVITEMLPDAGDLWLRDGQGRYCSELRMLMLHY